MGDEVLRYTDMAHCIQLAKSNGLGNREIIRALTGSMAYQEAVVVARRAAPLLEISVKEFMRLRKNG